MDSQTITNRSFWEKACDEYQQRLATYARRLAKGNAADANDLVQETMCLVLAHAGNPAGIERPIAYLFTVMRNAWITKWRKENQANLESLDHVGTRRALKSLPAIEPEVLVALENKEFQQALRVGKGPLSQREKQLLQLFLQGHKIQEIAEILGEDKRIISVELNAVRSKVRYRLKTTQATRGRT